VAPLRLWWDRERGARVELRGDARGASVRRVTVLGYGAFLLLGWGAVLVPSLIVSIKETFDRTDADFGTVYFVSAVFYAIGALGGGYLAQRIGPQTVLASALALFGLGLIVQARSFEWGIFIAAIAIGKGGGGAVEGGVQGVFLGLYPEQRGGALNWLHLFYGIGALLGPLAIAQFAADGRYWREIFIGSGVVFIAWAIAVVVTHRSVGRGHSHHLAHAPDDPDPASSLEFAPAELSLRPFIWLAVAIGCYEAMAMAVASWLVRYLSDDSERRATIALALLWAGVCMSRIAARWVSARLTSSTFALGCIILSSIALALGVVVPWPIVAVAMFGLVGLFSGPVYPLIIAIGGDLYPRRLSTLSGGLSFAATLGAVIYPPLIGFVAAEWGIGVGLFGGAVLGIPAAYAIHAARSAGSVARIEIPSY
jgi:fucose permease